MFRIVSRNMFRCARLAFIFSIVTVAAPNFAQLAEPQSASSSNPQAKTESETNLTARRQAALTLLDQVLAGSKNLSLPQNRIAIECEAFPLLWSRNESQARALVSQMTGDFAQAASRQNEDETPDQASLQALRQQWQVVLQTISQSDAELALSFMNASRSFVRTGSPEEEEAEERSLRLNLAAQEAAHNPRNALRAAEKDLQTPGDLPDELINLQTQVAAKDAEAGTELLRAIVNRVRDADLVAGESDFNFALHLLNTQFAAAANNSNPDDTLNTLADGIVSAALNPQFPPTMLPALQGSMAAVEHFAPGRAQPLNQKLTDYLHTLAPEDTPQDAVSQAQGSGDPTQLLAAAEQAPADIRFNLYQQAAWQLANSGDLQRARQAAENLPNSVQRDQLLQQAVRNAAWNACNIGQFAAARQLAGQITPEEDRVIILSQFALAAAAAKKDDLAQAMLDEASALLVNRPAGASLFAAQLQVAEAFAHLFPARAMPLLERSASQLQQVLAAAVEVDAFLPYQRSFENGELILNNGVLFNSLVEPYVQATAALANSDPAAARILADRLPLPEARLMAELSVARTALDAPSPPVIVPVRPGGFMVLVRN